jgi:hypothetical protein
MLSRHVVRLQELSVQRLTFKGDDAVFLHADNVPYLNVLYYAYLIRNRNKTSRTGFFFSSRKHSFQLSHTVSLQPFLATIRMPRTRTSRASPSFSPFEGFIALSIPERAQLAVSHYNSANLDDARHFDDKIMQDVASAGFDLTVPIKVGDSGPKNYRCRLCSATRRPEQFWRHFFTTIRPQDRCPETQRSDERE